MEYGHSGIYRSGRLQVFFKINVLKKFTIHRKSPVLEFLFNKVAGLKAYNFMKKRLRHRCFPVNIVKLLWTFSKIYRNFIEHLWWLLLDFLRNLLCRKSFLGRVFFGIVLEIISSICCSVSKNNSVTGFSQFLSFFNHVRGVSRTQSNIKMESIAKIVNGFIGVFRKKWNI